MRRLYDIIGIVAMIATPLAAATLFGWGLYEYLHGRSVPFVLAVAGGISGAVAIESVGIYAGHVGMDYARRRDWRGLVAAVAMTFYVWFGWSKVPEYGAVFVLAGFVYVLVALRQEATAVDAQQAQTARADTNWARRMELERERMRHDERLARISAKAQPAQVAAQPTAQPDKLHQQPGQLTPAQLRVYEAIQAQPTATNAEIAATLGVSRQAIDKHVGNMNGAVAALRGGG